MKYIFIPEITEATGIVSKDWKISRNNTKKIFNSFCTRNSWHFLR